MKKLLSTVLQINKSLEYVYKNEGGGCVTINDNENERNRKMHDLLFLFTLLFVFAILSFFLLLLFDIPSVVNQLHQKTS